MNLLVTCQLPCRLPRRRLMQLFRRVVKDYKKKIKFDELSLVVIGEKEIKKLNRQYRGQNSATDVLSWDYGEIFICWPVAKKQAREHKVSLADEICLLFVHGLLHILGYDHNTKTQRAKMQKAEKEILGYNGLVSKLQNVKLKYQKSK